MEGMKKRQKIEKEGKIKNKKIIINNRIKQRPSTTV